MSTLKNHRQMLSSGCVDSFSNYVGEIVPDNFVNVIGRHRDSDCLDESNFVTALKMLGGESESVRVEGFNHWAVGWIEEVFVDSTNIEKMKIVEDILNSLENYPVLNGEHFSQLEQEEADKVWSNCYNDQGRIDYIRKNRYQFDFNSLADLMGCVRGKYFAGYASELIY